MGLFDFFTGKYNYKEVEWKDFPKWVRKRIKNHITSSRSPPHPCIVTIRIKGKHRKYKYKYTCHEFPKKDWCYIRKRGKK